MKDMTIAELLAAIQTTAETDGCRAIACVIIDDAGCIHELDGGAAPYLLMGGLESLKMRIFRDRIQHAPIAMATGIAQGGANVPE